eukprot:COSAG05_NODE_6940_length_878_cov_1.010270_1_plen_210_part_01
MRRSVAKASRAGPRTLCRRLSEFGPTFCISRSVYQNVSNKYSLHTTLSHLRLTTTCISIVDLARSSTTSIPPYFIAYRARRPLAASLALAAAPAWRGRVMQHRTEPRPAAARRVLTHGPHRAMLLRWALCAILLAVAPEQALLESAPSPPPQSLPPGCVAGAAEAVAAAGLLPVTLLGAKGDGVSDDLHAIQAAVECVYSVGGIVFFPPG